MKEALGSFGMLASMGVGDTANFADALRKVSETTDLRLIKVKGRRRVKSVVVELSWKSLNKVRFIRAAIVSKAQISKSNFQYS